MAPSAQLILTERPGHATELAMRWAPEVEHIIAVGGDGTVREVVLGMLAANAQACSLSVMPAGRANDLAGTLGLVASAGAARSVAVDVGWVEPVGLPFMTVAGCGFDSRVVERMRRRPRLYRGRGGYTLGVLAEAVALRPMRAHVTVDGQEVEGDFTLIAIANTPAYGGGMLIAPQADPTDGLLDVVLVGALSRARLLRVFPLVFRGAHVGLEQVRIVRGRNIALTTSPPTPVILDGDLCARTPLTLTVRPGGVRLLAP